MPDQLRAETPEQKREVIERLYAAWLTSPTERLGQFIWNRAGGDLFFIEDTALLAILEKPL